MILYPSVITDLHLHKSLEKVKTTTYYTDVHKGLCSQT